jgi:hypothetical protein
MKRYTNHIISRVLLCGHETWSPILMEENRLKAFRNKVLRRIFGFKSEEGIGGLRKIHVELLNITFN